MSEQIPESAAVGISEAADLLQFLTMTNYIRPVKWLRSWKIVQEEEEADAVVKCEFWFFRDPTDKRIVYMSLKKIYIGQSAFWAPKVAKVIATSGESRWDYNTDQNSWTRHATVE